MNTEDSPSDWTAAASDGLPADHARLAEEIDLLRHQLRWAEHCAVVWRDRCRAVANSSHADIFDEPVSLPGVQRMQLSGIHHVAVIASDYARSKRFYTEVLGLKVVAEAYREARDSWKLDLAVPGGAQIELFSFPDPPPRPSRPEACGLRHLALRVDDLDAAVAHLDAHGVEAEAIRVDEYTGKRFTFFADPDGLPLELYEA